MACAALGCGSLLFVACSSNTQLSPDQSIADLDANSSRSDTSLDSAVDAKSDQKSPPDVPIQTPDVGLDDAAKNDSALPTPDMAADVQGSDLNSNKDTATPTPDQQLAPDLIATKDAWTDLDPSDPCYGIVCNTPPPPGCYSTSLLKTYDPVGKCSYGNCYYTPHSSLCPTGQSCFQGACCTPSCPTNVCGADDGCGGACQTGTCPTGKMCAKGVCSTSWAIKPDGMKESRGMSVAVDASGNAYVTGVFYGITTFGSTPALTCSSSAKCLFITKIDPSGNFLWAKMVGDHNSGNGIAVDAGGKVYVTGDFSWQATFGSTTLTTPGWDQYMFVTKMDASGNFLWAKKVGGSVNGSKVTGEAIAVGSGGEAHVTGNYFGQATFGATTLTTSSPGTPGARYVTKLDASGNFLWAKKVADDINGDGIAVDASGDAYITGGFTGQVTIGATTLTATGQREFFITRMASATGQVLWVKNAPGTHAATGTGVALDASGNAFVSGGFQGQATFGATTLTTPGTIVPATFVTKVSPSGQFLWANQENATASIYGWRA